MMLLIFKDNYKNSKDVNCVCVFLFLFEYLASIMTQFSLFLEQKKNHSTRTLNSFIQGLRFKNKGFNWILKYKYLIICMFGQYKI